MLSNQDSNLKSLLSPSKSGTFFAPFRSRSANPDGFDSKMKLWINAIEEWAVINKKLTFSLKDIQQEFISDNDIRPDKECIRLVLSEMKRRLRIGPLQTLKSSSLWSTSTSLPLLDSLIDPKGWLSWSVKKLVFSSTNWAVSALAGNHDQAYSDLTDMSIADSTRFVSQKSLNELSQNLLSELVRISKAERQFCFEWQHLLELITPIMNYDTTDGKELLEMLDILIEYLAIKKQVAIQIDNDSRLVKVANIDDPKEDEVTITQKDVALARLLRAKELLTADADRYHDQALRAKQDAIRSYSNKELAKAKSLLRSHKRLTACAGQKEAQLSNVETMLDQLENTDSNMMILKAYKDGAEALKTANTNLDNNVTILDEIYDATAEARYLNDEMNQMLKDISCVSQGITDATIADLEAELNGYIETDDKANSSTDKIQNKNQDNSVERGETVIDDKFVDELEQKLNSLVVCQDEPICPSELESTPRKKDPLPSKAS